MFSGSRESGYGASGSLRPYAMGAGPDEGTGQRLSWGISAGDSILVRSDGKQFHVTPLTGTLGMTLNAWEA